VTNSGPTIGMTWRLWISCNRKRQSVSGRKRSFAHTQLEGNKVRLSREAFRRSGVTESGARRREQHRDWRHNKKNQTGCSDNWTLVALFFTPRLTGNPRRQPEFCRTRQCDRVPPRVSCSEVSARNNIEKDSMTLRKRTGLASTRSRLLFLGKRCCESWLPFPFKWQPNIATQKSTSSSRRWREHFPTPPSLPALQPQLRCRSFPAKR
jgi:hypothetical protein